MRWRLADGALAGFQRQKQRMVYQDPDEQDEDEIAPRTFSVEEKLASTRYSAQFVLEKNGSGMLCISASAILFICSVFKMLEWREHITLKSKIILSEIEVSFRTKI